MKILFTGASSFTGFWLVAGLAAAGHQVTCPLTRGVAAYTDLRRRRVEQLPPLARLIPDAPFGSDPFLQLAGAEPFDLLCHLAFNAPLRTRRERAQTLKSERKDYFDKFSPEARQILDELLEKYAEHGDAQFLLPDVLRVPPISTHGQPAEIIRLFGGPEQLRQAVNELQGLLYAA